MSHPRETLIAGLTAVTLLATPGLAQHAGSNGNGPAEPKDIVEIAVAAGSFETLVAAVKAAGLVETLQGEGPFTVFAPSDEAFAKLPAGTVESLLKPENREQLRAVLTYHVVPGRLMSAEVVKRERAGTVLGEEVEFSVKDGTAMIEDARIVEKDIVASNGVIHVIDSVILPDGARP